MTNFCVLNQSMIVFDCCAGDDPEKQKKCAYFDARPTDKAERCRHLYSDGTARCENAMARKNRAAVDAQNRVRTEDGPDPVYVLLFQAKELITDYMSQQPAVSRFEDRELMKRGIRINAAIGLTLAKGVSS